MAGGIILQRGLMKPLPAIAQLLLTPCPRAYLIPRRFIAIYITLIRVRLKIRNGLCIVVQNSRRSLPVQLLVVGGAEPPISTLLLAQSPFPNGLTRSSKRLAHTSMRFCGCSFLLLRLPVEFTPSFDRTHAQKRRRNCDPGKPARRHVIIQAL